LGSGAKPVLCVTGRGPFDEAAAKMLLQLLEKHGLEGRLEDSAAVSSSNIVRLSGRQGPVRLAGDLPAPSGGPPESRPRAVSADPAPKPSDEQPSALVPV